MASNKNMSSLMKEYRQLAKQADQRLVRLEKLSDKKGFENVLEHAYSRAMKSIEKWSGSGASRFNRKPPATEAGLRSKISDIKRFLGMSSSSKAKIKRNYMKRADKINEQYGTDITWEDLDDLFESEQWEKLAKEYGSKTAMKVIGQIQDNKDYIKNKLESGKKVNFNLKNKKVGQAVEETIAKYGIDVIDMF